MTKDLVIQTNAYVTTMWSQKESARICLKAVPMVYIVSNAIRYAIIINHNLCRLFVVGMKLSFLASPS